MISQGPRRPAAFLAALPLRYLPGGPATWIGVALPQLRLLPSPTAAHPCFDAPPAPPPSGSAAGHSLSARTAGPTSSWHVAAPLPLDVPPPLVLPVRGCRPHLLLALRHPASFRREAGHLLQGEVGLDFSPFRSSRAPPRVPTQNPACSSAPPLVPALHPASSHAQPRVPALNPASSHRLDPCSNCCQITREARPRRRPAPPLPSWKTTTNCHPQILDGIPLPVLPTPKRWMQHTASL
nr:U1 small nuclear ribonucleoprotein C-1-like [Aegilops tauschii subsp. strangulata]